MSDKKKFKTITLTGRPPVKIVDEDWPFLASAEYNDDHGCKIGNNPDREEDWELNVRQHEDGRLIVYAIYSFVTCYERESCEALKGGDLVDKDEDVIKAIRRVGEEIEGRMTRGQGVFPRLIHECIAALPAEELV